MPFLPIDQRIVVRSTRADTFHVRAVLNREVMLDIGHEEPDRYPLGWSLGDGEFEIRVQIRKIEKEIE